MELIRKEEGVLKNTEIVSLQLPENDLKLLEISDLTLALFKSKHMKCNPQEIDEYIKFLLFVLENIDINENFELHNEFMNEPLDFNDYIDLQTNLIINGINARDKHLFNRYFILILIEHSKKEEILENIKNDQIILDMQSKLSSESYKKQRNFYEIIKSIHNQSIIEKPSFIKNMLKY